MSVDLSGKKKKPGEIVNALKQRMPYTTGGTKVPQPKSKLDLKKNYLGIKASF